MNILIKLMATVTVEDEQRELELIQESAPILKKQQSSAPSTPRKVSIRIESEDDDGKHLTIPTTIAVTSSSETLTGRPFYFRYY